MSGELTVQYKDYSGEPASVGLETADTTTTEGFTAFNTAVTNFLLYGGALMSGTQQNRSFRAFNLALDNDVPTDPHAQRELKWFIPLHATSAIPAGYRRDRSFTLPVAKLVGAGDVPLVVRNQKVDWANLSADEWSDFIAWFNGQNVFFPGYEILDTPYLVGRNI